MRRRYSYFFFLNFWLRRISYFPRIYNSGHFVCFQCFYGLNSDVTFLSNSSPKTSTKSQEKKHDKEREKITKPFGHRCFFYPSSSASSPSPSTAPQAPITAMRATWRPSVWTDVAAWAHRATSQTPTSGSASVWQRAAVWRAICCVTSRCLMAGRVRERQRTGKAASRRVSRENACRVRQPRPLPLTGKEREERGEAALDAPIVFHRVKVSCVIVDWPRATLRIRHRVSRAGQWESWHAQCVRILFLLNIFIFIPYFISLFLFSASHFFPIFFFIPLLVLFSSHFSFLPILSQAMMALSHHHAQPHSPPATSPHGRQFASSLAVVCALPMRTVAVARAAMVCANAAGPIFLSHTIPVVIPFSEREGSV